MTMEQGLATVAVAEAVIESASTGRTMDVAVPQVSLGARETAARA